MKAYADTGFLVKLYLAEPATPAAIGAIKTAKLPILLSPLCCLEMRNALHLNVFQKRIKESVRKTAWEAFEADLEAGTYEVMPIPSTELYEKTAELADQHSATIGTRSLDLLHIASALILEVDVLFSFDTRQRLAAEKEGLEVRP